MKNNRRDFLKLTGLAGISIAGAGIVPGCAATKTDKGKSNLGHILVQATEKHTQRFNPDRSTRMKEIVEG